MGLLCENECAKVRKTNLRYNFQHAENDTIFSEIISKHFRAHDSTSHSPWDLQCRIVCAKVPSGNLPAKIQHRKNETISSEIFIKQFPVPIFTWAPAMHRAALHLPLFRAASQRDCCAEPWAVKSNDAWAPCVTQPRPKCQRALGAGR